MSSIYRVSSFSELMDYISMDLLINGIGLYRGQSMHKGLLPGLARGDYGDKNLAAEPKILAQLERYAGAAVNSSMSYLDKLVMAQHHNLKTRLLDWTTNPLVALWFACSSSLDEDGYLYIILDGSSLIKDDPYSVYMGGEHEMFLFQPIVNNPRVLAQHGWFSYHAGNLSEIKRSFNNFDDDTLICIEIDSSCKSEVLRYLDKLGVNKRTLFPDLDGLCQYLNTTYTL